MERTFSDYFNTTDAKLAQKALDYLDGSQLQHVIALLDNPTSGRREWRERGMRPNYRNIVSMVIDKSAMLFQDEPPTIEVYHDDSMVKDNNSTEILNDILEDANWVQFMVNVDQVIRLLKTAIVLVQFNNEEGEIILDCLHKANAYVYRNPITRKVTELIYRVDVDEDQSIAYYRVITNDVIEDWVEELDRPGAKAKLVSSTINPYQMIPIAEFYDTKTPRVGFWNKIPSDLIHLNEAYNMYLVDLEFGASWSIHKTLFTNARIEGGEGPVSVEQVYGSVLPRQTTATPGVVGGLSKVVYLDTTGVDNPFVEFKGPEVDLEAPTKVMSNWVRDYASDWGVRVKVAGEGTPTSGFQLIVEEFDNVELRKVRSKMMEDGLKRMCETIIGVWVYHYPGTFAFDPSVYVEFATPSLPTDQKQDEEIWSMKIKEKRATPIDYYMETLGMTRDEAEQKWLETKTFFLNEGGIVDPAEMEGLWSQRIFEGRATREDYFRAQGLDDDQIQQRLEKIDSSSPPREPPTQKFEVSV